MKNNQVKNANLSYAGGSTSDQSLTDKFRDNANKVLPHFLCTLKLGRGLANTRMYKIRPDSTT